jgi:hypothetical protein
MNNGGSMNTREGTVVQAGDWMLVVMGKDGKERTLPVNEKTVITLNGAACKLEDLRAGAKVCITPTREDKKPMLAKIEATTA